MGDVDVRVVHLEGCPSWRTAEQRLVQALTRIGRSDTPVALVQVDSIADAAAAGFAGSPTILVDGQDLFPIAAAPVGLTCRLYPGRDGMGGSPTVEDLG